MAVQTENRPSLAERVLRRLTAGPMGRQILAEQQAETMAERKGLVSEVARVQAEREKVIPPADVRVSEALETLKTAHQRLRDSEASYKLAVNDRRSIGVRLDKREQVSRAALRELAPPAIAGFKRDLDAIDTGSFVQRRLDATPTQRLSTDMMGAPVYGLSTEVRERVSAGALAELQTARAAVEELQTCDLNDEAIVAMLAAMRSSLGLGTVSNGV